MALNIEQKKYFTVSPTVGWFSCGEGSEMNRRTKEIIPPGAEDCAKGGTLPVTEC